MDRVTKKPLYQIINGIRSLAIFSPQCFKEALEYKPQPDDNFIVSFPKCGTTWMQNIVVYIFRKGQRIEDYGDFYLMSPFIDMLGLEGLNKMERPGAIKTHLPYNYMPYSQDAKYIFVTRNPRDTCVSLFYHTRMISGAGYHDGKFDDFFELFMAGEVEYNDYFDHLLSWYPHRHDKNIWYTTYEQMKADPKGTICKVAKFLGKEYSEAIEKDNAVMNNILEFTSFEYMKKYLNDYTDDFMNRDRLLADPNTPEGIKYEIRYTMNLNLPEQLPENDFIRKGIVGDWKNHLSQEQLNRLNQKFAEKTKGTDLDTWWSY